MNAIDYINDLIKDGRRVGIFSCEDPYNTPFHRDLFELTDYMHFVPKAAGIVIPESLDLGLQAKKINAWGIFGHYGVVHGQEVCAAIAALNNGHHSYGPDLRKYVELLASQYEYQPQKSLRENIEDWIKNQYDLLLKLVQEKKAILKGSVQGDIVIFAGLVENLKNGKDYKARTLFSNHNGTRH